MYFKSSGGLTGLLCCEYQRILQAETDFILRFDGNIILSVRSQPSQSRLSLMRSNFNEIAGLLQGTRRRQESIFQTD